MNLENKIFGMLITFQSLPNLKYYMVSHSQKYKRIGKADF